MQPQPATAFQDAAPVASQSCADKPLRWAALVAELTTSFDEIVRLAAQHPGDAILSRLATKAEAGKRALLRHNVQFSSQPHGFGSLGEWGQNGRAPMVRAMLTEARMRAGVA